MSDLLRRTALSPCKLNLFLYVTGKRDDGFHDLQSLFCMTDFGDTMRFAVTDDGKGEIRISPDFGFPVTENLIFKACRLLQRHSGRMFSADIGVEKRIPQGGGLGGGSSNAATTLNVINSLLRLGADTTTLRNLGAELGSDVPFFVNGRHAFVEGRGEVLHDVDESLLPFRHFTVMTPKCHVSTKDVFTDPDLPEHFSPVRTFDELMRLPFGNDCIPIVRKKFCDVGQVLDMLVKYGAAAMSGTGASCFASFATSEEAKKAALELKKLRSDCLVFTASAACISPV